MNIKWIKILIIFNKIFFYWAIFSHQLMNKKEKEVVIHILKGYDSDERKNDIEMIYILRKKFNAIKQQLNNQKKLWTINYN